MKPVLKFMLIVAVLVSLKPAAAASPALPFSMSHAMDSTESKALISSPVSNHYYKKPGFFKRLQYKLVNNQIFRLTQKLQDGTKPKKNLLSTLSIIFGVVGAVVLFIPSIAAVALIAGPAALVTGIIALGKNYNNSKASRAKAIIGVVLGSLLVFLLLMAVIIVASWGGAFA